MACVWRSENILAESAVSFYHVDPGELNSGHQTWWQITLSSDILPALSEHF